MKTSLDNWTWRKRSVHWKPGQQKISILEYKKKKKSRKFIICKLIVNSQYSCKTSSRKRGKQENRRRNIFKKHQMKAFQNLRESSSRRYQKFNKTKAEQIPRKITSRHIINKMWKTKDKEQILTAA